MRGAMLSAAGLVCLVASSGCNGFGGIRVCDLEPSGSAFSDATGVGIENRWTGVSVREDRPDSRWMWSLSADTVRYDRAGATDPDDVFLFMLSTGIGLHPELDIFLRAGVAYVTHKDPTGEKENGYGAEVALAWMLPVGTVDVALEVAGFWAQPGDEALDGVTARIGIYYMYDTDF